MACNSIKQEVKELQKKQYETTEEVCSSCTVLLSLWYEPYNTIKLKRNSIGNWFFSPPASDKQQLSLLLHWSAHRIVKAVFWVLMKMARIWQSCAVPAAQMEDCWPFALDCPGWTWGKQVNVRLFLKNIRSCFPSVVLSSTLCLSLLSSPRLDACLSEIMSAPSAWEAQSDPVLHTHTHKPSLSSFVFAASSSPTCSLFLYDNYQMSAFLAVILSLPRCLCLCQNLGRMRITKLWIICLG